MFDWIKGRMKERTSWDGMCLIVLGLMVLLLSPLAKFGAVIAMGYGFWTIIQPE